MTKELLKKIPLKKIRPFKRNPRLNNSAIDYVCKSIKNNGYIAPIVVDEDFIILAGHTRYKALERMEFKDCDIVKVSGLTEKQKQEYRVMDNKSSELASWNFKLLKLDYTPLQLKDLGFDLKVDFGFDDKSNSNANNIPEIKDKDIKCKTGNLWQLGRHRLLCADATKKENYKILLQNKKMDLVFTSPPYNSGNADFTYKYKDKKQGGFYRTDKDDKSKKEYFNFLISVLTNIKNVVSDKHSVFWNVMYNANSRDDYGKIIFSDQNPLKVRETIIWNKISGFPVAGNNILSRQCELIFLLSNSKKYLTNQNLRTAYWNRWDISSQNAQSKEQKHKACFPVDLPRKALLDFGFENCNCLDPFLGSGTTMIACEQTKRICFGMDVDPWYFDIAIKRWENFTKKKAKLIKK